MARKFGVRHGGQPADALRYYIYVSDTKIDQLFAQVPAKLLKRLTVEASVNLKVVQFTLKQNPVDENRFSRLRVVERFIVSHGGVGTIDEPGPWLQGSIKVRWGLLPGRAPREAAPPPSPGVSHPDSHVVFFVGKSRSTILGMGGSAHHVLGATPETPGERELYSVGSVPIVLSEHLERASRQPVDLWDVDPIGPVLSPIPLTVSLGLVHRTWKNANVPQQTVSFLAKRLTEEHDLEGIPAAVLATPLFVAQVD
jgi:hypothetical protein